MNAAPLSAADDLYRLRHSTAHVLAHAVTDLFPQTKLAIGPPIEDGFYYDFELLRPLVPQDLREIERRMREIIAADERFVCREVSLQEARRLFHDQPYKEEILDELEQNGAPITVYRQGSFQDLCRGPHVQRTGEINPEAFALLDISGAYWRGDESREMLQRIYGTVWPDRKQLEVYLWRREEAKRRDHRVLGRELHLFSVSDQVGPGLILWHPKGAMVRMVAEDFMRRAHLEHGYQWVVSPHIGRATLWQTSGHLDYFADSMYPAIEAEDGDYYLKPMSCPFHIEIYKSRLRSYRDLPMRLAEYGTVYRYERSGTVHGLTRARGFTQDDAHIFCRPEDVRTEIDRALEFSLAVIRAFGLTDIKAYLSTRPDKAVGDDADWEMATAALRDAMVRHRIDYEVDEGGGTFYGAKIDLKARDAIGREWQLSTIQFDFTLPERFGLEYIGEDNQPHRPYMVHRALLGSIERFFGVLVEHYAGGFPVWLAPVQAIVIPISGERHLPYARDVCARLASAGLRIEVDDGKDRLNAKIRNAQLAKVPYMLVVGDRERDAGEVAVRSRSGEDLGPMSPGMVEELIRAGEPRLDLTDSSYGLPVSGRGLSRGGAPCG